MANSALLSLFAHELVTPFSARLWSETRAEREFA